jgi:hypothetical protein
MPSSFHRDDAKVVVRGEVASFKLFACMAEAMVWMVVRGNKEAYLRVTGQLEENSGMVRKNLTLDCLDNEYRSRHEAVVSSEENIV